MLRSTVSSAFEEIPQGKDEGIIVKSLQAGRIRPCVMDGAVAESAARMVRVQLGMECSSHSRGTWLTYLTQILINTDLSFTLDCDPSRNLPIACVS